MLSGTGGASGARRRQRAPKRAKATRRTGRAKAALRAPTPSSRSTKNGAIAVDERGLTLSVGGVRANLTPSELKLIKRLVRAGDWIPKQTLAATINKDGSDALVRVHVLNIRRKLGRQAFRLESDRTRGYRLMS